MTCVARLAPPTATHVLLWTLLSGFCHVGGLAPAQPSPTAHKEPLQEQAVHMVHCSARSLFHMLALLQIGLLLLLKDAAQGLLYVHRRNVVHGDFNVSACQLSTVRNSHAHAVGLHCNSALHHPAVVKPLEYNDCGII
jgi:hypothetical protein